MPHIHVKPGEHDHSVNAYILRDNGDQPLMMLIMHKKLGRLLPSGGHVELNETVWQAVAHELEEEAGYEITELDIFQPRLRMKTVSDIIIHPQPFLTDTHSLPGGHYHSNLSYAFMAQNLPLNLPDEGESTDIRWLSRGQIEELSSADIMPSTKDICMYIFDELLTSAEMERVPASSFSLEKPAQIE